MKSLKQIKFSEILSWDVKHFLQNNDIFSKKIPLVLFREFISKPSINKISINDSETYKILGVRSYGKGTYINREIKGDTLKMRMYQQVGSNHLFWCKVDTKNGAFGIIDDELANGVASTNMTFAKIDTKIANTEYVQLLFRSKKINEYMDAYVTGTTNRKYIRPDQLFNEIKIPFPDLTTQVEIVDAYNEKIKLAQEQEQKASKLENGIDIYLFEKLGIDKKAKRIKTIGLNIIDFKNLDIWGADKLLNGGLGEILKSKYFENKKLNTLVLVNPRTDLSNIDSDDSMSFIPMKNVSDNYGEVLLKNKGLKSNSGGYTKFKDGDLIWARITPCMQNGKSAIVSELNNGLGYGSTEYHVLRKKEDNFLIEYLYHLLRTKDVRDDAVNHFTGSAGQQRVPKAYLENLLVPVPPLEIQKEIIETINEIKVEIKELNFQARRNREQAIQEFENKIFKS